MFACHSGQRTSPRLVYSFALLKPNGKYSQVSRYGQDHIFEHNSMFHSSYLPAKAAPKTANPSARWPRVLGVYKQSAYSQTPAGHDLRNDGRWTLSRKLHSGEKIDQRQPVGGVRSIPIRVRLWKESRVMCRT